MKKNITILLGILFSLQVFSQNQTFIDFGPKVLFGPNAFINEAMGNERFTPSYKSAGWGGGFKLAFDFNTRVAIVSEAIYRQQKQVYSITLTDPSTGLDYLEDKFITMKSIEIPVMLRHNSETMQYVEGGVVFSNISGVMENEIGMNGTGGTSDVSPMYQQNNTGAILGFGGYLWGEGNFGISVGLRFRYDFNDIVNYDPTARYEGAPYYPMDNAVVGTTNPFSLALVVEANYDLGFMMAKSSCNGRRRFLIGN